MARPIKKGLDYFPFDVYFFEDEKIEAISGEFGIKGEITTIKLLCAVYRNGYFIVWNELFKMKLLRSLPGINSELIDQILNRLVKWGFFDKSLFDSDKILTSVAIQKRYFTASKRRKSKEELKYLLINVYDNEVNVNNNPVNAYNNSQRKGNKKKEEIKKEENPFFQAVNFIPIEEFRETVLNNSSRNEECRRALRCSPERLQNLIEEFETEQVAKGNGTNTDREYRKHFINWSKIKIEKNGNEKEFSGSRYKDLT